MSKKDYVAIAETVNRLDLHYADIQHVALMLADTLKKANERFDRVLFIAACMKGH